MEEGEAEERDGTGEVDVKTDSRELLYVSLILKEETRRRCQITGYTAFIRKREEMEGKGWYGRKRSKNGLVLICCRLTLNDRTGT